MKAFIAAVALCAMACGSLQASDHASLGGATTLAKVVASETMLASYSGGASSADGAPLLEIELYSVPISACSSSWPDNEVTVGELQIIPVPDRPLEPFTFDIVPSVLDHAATTQSGPLGGLEIDSEPHGRSISKSGTVTLTYVSDHELIGTATAVMDNGDNVTVTFSAPSCDTLKW